jgi:type II restriction/modification system DNA methylase subunit YeeA
VTPQDFIAKWRAVELKERSAAQSHFNDLCRLLGLDDPVAADPRGTWFTFEKGATKTSGGEGWADVWRKGCFAWEYKGRHKDLAAAHRQLLNYAGALDNPPLLVTCDMDRIVIHTNWTNTVQETHALALDDLLDGAKRDLLKAAFTDPERLKPAKTRQALTEEAAARFAALAQRLRAHGHDAQTVAHFVNRLVFCMFAEDVGLLPGSLFLKMLEAARPRPDLFEGHARTLFAAMKEGGFVGFERVEWFNGGLFDDDRALPLERVDIDDLLEAARLDWSQIDPSILGTLFERGLDPDKRSQLGAHYTDRDKIMKIVNPVIVEPLLAEWAVVKAEIETALAREKAAASPSAATRAHNAALEARARFLERLKNFRVLDPGCGSGNFLYLALRALKDVEHRVHLEAEALGLPRAFPAVGPEAVRGIEINPYAAELARVSVWIGEIQWMRSNGYDAGRNPILRPLDTIECRDAILNEDGTRVDWPDADVVVGNPPFLGGKRLLSVLGDEYVAKLRAAYVGLVEPFADLVCYWFLRASQQIERGSSARAGLVATNSIRGGASRETLKRITTSSRIFEAWSDEPWVVDGAAVRVSLVCFGKTREQATTLDGRPVSSIHPDLTAGEFDISSAKRLATNRGVCFEGGQKYGAFDISGPQARSWLSLPINPNGSRNSIVLRPYLNPRDVVRRTEDNWIIDFGSRSRKTRVLFSKLPSRMLRRTCGPIAQI